MQNCRRSAILLALAACGDNRAAAPDAFVPSIDAPSFVEAPHPATPQMVKLSGDVLTAPRIVPIFFANDAAMQAQIEDYLHQLASSSYWGATTNEYGVGALTIAPTIVTADAPPTTDTDLAPWIGNHFDGQAGWPAQPDPQTIYAVFLPEGAVLHTSFGDSCRAFGGYHDEATGPQSQSVVFALLPRCEGGTRSPLDNLTLVTSHEMIEAATDPRAETAPGFQELDADHYVWAYTPGPEVGDMCELVPGAAQRLVGSYVVQRTWSNASAAAGHDPCVPVLAEPYIAAAPMLAETAAIDSIHTGAPSLMTHAVSIPVGTSKTIDVVLFSDAAIADYTVEAYDVAAFFGMPAELTFTWDRDTGHNGDVLHLTITRAATGTRPGLHGGSEFLLATVVHRNVQTLWSGLAGD
jgi:hypothetical protein